MNRCTFSPKLLSAFMDDEAGDFTSNVAAHVAMCQMCHHQIQRWRRQRDAWVDQMDEKLGEPDLTVALVGIRHRIAAQKNRSLKQRLCDYWQNLVLFHRQALAGVAFAIALGALAAPIIFFWAVKQLPAHSAATAIQAAGVTMESVEREGTAQPAVYRPAEPPPTILRGEEQKPQGQEPGDSLLPGGHKKPCY